METGPMTLVDSLKHEVGVLLHCNACQHDAVLDTAAMIQKLGPRFPVPEIGKKCRCSRCGSKDISSRPDGRYMGPSESTITLHT